MTRTLTTVAADLKQLARGRSQGEKALHALAATLEGADRTVLVGIDLAGAYDPTVMLPEGRPVLRWLTNVLELARDVLIFVPIIYTWQKLSEALTAYGHYSGSDQFLLAWQNGFGGRTQPLSTTASVVAAVVLSVVVLTIVAYLTRASYEQAVQRRQQQLAKLLAETSTLLARSVIAGSTDVTRAELATIGATIARSSEALRDALTKAGTDIVSAVNTSPGSKLHDMFKQWTAAANELKVLGARLQGTQDVVVQLRETQLALSTTANQITAETSRLISALESERSVSRQEAHAHHELASQVNGSTTLLRESLMGLNQRAEQFNEMVLRLAFIVDRLDDDGSRVRVPGGGYS